MFQCQICPIVTITTEAILRRIQVEFDNCFPVQIKLNGSQSIEKWRKGWSIRTKIELRLWSNGWMLSKPGISRATMHFRTPDVLISFGQLVLHPFYTFSNCNILLYNLKFLLRVIPRKCHRLLTSSKKS